MNPALIKLFLLLNKAAFRRAIRGARTFRGALVLLIGLGALVLWPAIGLFSYYFLTQPGVERPFGSIGPYLSMYLLLMCLANLIQSAKTPPFYFSAPEVEFLFPAPIHRRELLLFKLMSAGVTVFVVAVFMAISPMLMFLKSWLSAFVGTLLALSMVTLLGIALRLIGQIVAESAYNRTRKAILMVLGILIAAGVSQAFSAGEARSLAGFVQSFGASWPGRVVLAPLDIFSHAILAERLFPDLIGWGAAATAIDLGLLILVLKLDADYIERAAEFSQLVYERVQRMKQSGGFHVAVPKRAVRLRVPRLPWLGGAGPIAWRQLLIIVRTYGRTVMVALSMATILIVGGAFVAWQNSSTAPLYPLAVVVFVYATFGLSVLPCAFRGDIDQLDVLKALPVSPLAITVGELSAGVLMIAAVQLAILAVSCLVGIVAVPMALAVLAFAPAANMMMIASNNLIVLLYPVRLVSTSPDFQRLGRLLLSLMIRSFILVLGLGFPAVLGVLVNLVTGLSWLAGLVAWLTLVAELPPMVMLVAWAFQRFDASTETPVS